MSSASPELVAESPKSSFLSRIFSGLYSAYSNLNGATLTGAIDIIVVEHADGSLHCSPFHVRFGKASVLSSKEKEVEITVNGEAVEGIQMQLGDSGEAYFLEEIPEIEFAALQAQQNGQTHKAAQRKPSEVNPPTKRVIGRKKSVYCKSVQERRDEIANQLMAHEEEPKQSKKLDDGTASMQRRKRFTKTRSDTQQKSLDGSSSDEELFNFELDGQESEDKEGSSRQRAYRQRRSGLQSLKSMERHLSFQIAEDVIPRLSLQICSEAELSDHESNERGARLSSAKSDTEIDKGDTEDANWGWGRLPLMEGDMHMVGGNLQVPLNRRLSRRSIGSRLSLTPVISPKVEKAVETKPSETNTTTKKISGEVFLDDLLPAAEKDPRLSEKYFGRPRSTSEVPRRKSRSMPSDLALSLCGGLESESGEDPGLEAFEQCRVTFDALCADPSLVDHPSLVIRIGGELFSWKAAAPLVASLLVFQRTLPPSVISTVRERHMNFKNLNSPTASIASSPTTSGGWWLWRSSTSHQSDSGVSADENSSSVKLEITVEEPKTVKPSEAAPKNQEYREWLGSHGEVLTKVSGKPYRKTLRLSSDRLKQLGLVSGRNDVEFSVTTSLQGTTRCTCHIFFWHETDKVVISDIDGTITISDILGHVMPMLGKGWEHSGVAGLFNKVANNGYKFIYLSARAIGQATMTRGYLKSIRQGSLSLPEGPVLLNPTSLLSAFHREVIIKRPQDFKISCLKDIQSLFPAQHKPFYAGFGNRLTDTLSYRAVSIETSRIFTINPKGELSQELVGANIPALPEEQNLPHETNSSYEALSDIANDIFPPLDEEQLKPETNKNVVLDIECE